MYQARRSHSTTHFALSAPNNPVVQISDEDFNKLRPKGNFNEQKQNSD